MMVCKIPFPIGIAKAMKEFDFGFRRQYRNLEVDNIAGMPEHRRVGEIGALRF